MPKPPIHILYISQYFPPEFGAGSARAYELAKRWADAGSRVTVLTGFPSYPTGGPPPASGASRATLTRRERVDGITLIRSRAINVGKRRSRDRLLAYSSFALSAALRGIALTRPNIIVASSPPLTVGMIGWWISRIKRAPFVLDVRDLWPQSITDLGAASPGSLPDRALAAMADFLYQRAARVAVTSPATANALTDRNKLPPNAILTIPNGVETATFAPASDADSTDAFAPGDAPDAHLTRQSLGLADKFVISFIGTIGMAQDLATIISAADILARSAPQAHFLFIGDGPAKQRIVDAVADRNLPNITFLPVQPRQRIPELIRASHACLVTLRKTPVNDIIIPVRMLEFMSCASPVLLAAAGEPARILREARAGLIIPQQDPAALANAIARLIAAPTLRHRLGASGRAHILRHFSRPQTADAYLTALRQIANP